MDIHVIENISDIRIKGDRQLQLILYLGIYHTGKYKHLGEY